MPEKILVPIEGSRTSGQVLDEATKLAKVTGVSPRLLNVMDL